MTREECEEKAFRAYESGLTPYDKIDEYADHLYHKYTKKGNADD